MAEKELHFEDVELGDDIGPVERTITDEQVQAFVQIWGAESGPSRFTSEEVAKGEGLPGMIVPGAMNVGVISQLLTGWSSSVVLKTLDLMFRQMVRHDVPILLKGIVTDKNLRSSATSGWKAPTARALSSARRSSSCRPGSKHGLLGPVSLGG